MAKRLMDLAPWLGALGVLIMLVGLGWDGLLHAQDPALAARDGVFTLTNPGRALFAVGLALCVLTAVYYLVGLAQSRFLRVPGLRALCWAAAIVLVVAAIGSLTLTLGRGNDTSGYARTAATTDLTALPNPHAQHSALTSAQASTPTPVAGCDFAPIDLNKYGKVPFQSADVKSAVNGIVEATLWVTYTNATSTTIGGCPVQLRSYNGNLIGPTLRVKPGDTISITLHNDLPDNLPVEDPDHGAALDYNTTNVHTHGLHVSPTGNSDNVLLEITPGQDFYFEIKVPPDHPPGTYWYHPHVHGSTAIQVSSSMAGALIIEGGLDDVPQIKAAQDQVMVLQQIPYDQSGVIETYDNFGPCSWEATYREHTINGQLYPTIQMAPGEVQRWRFIHAGVRETISAELHGPNTLSDTTVITDILALPTVNLNEIALDGIALGKIDTWQEVELEPGYRSDVLVKLDKPGIYYLVDGQSPAESLTCPSSPELPSLLAQIVVQGSAHDMALPVAADLAALAPFTSLLQLDQGRPIVPDNVGPNDLPANNNPKPASGVTVNGFQRASLTVSTHNGSRPFQFLAGEHPFSLARARTLKLGSVDEWILQTTDDSFYYAHPFHIHVNPFQTWRTGPDSKPELIWKDTILVPKGKPQYIFTHYTDYIGQFVYHCHILDHEDSGMMELLEIVR